MPACRLATAAMVAAFAACGIPELAEAQRWSGCRVPLRDMQLAPRPHHQTIAMTVTNDGRPSTFPITPVYQHGAPPPTTRVLTRPRHGTAAASASASPARPIWDQGDDRFEAQIRGTDARDIPHIVTPTVVVTELPP